MLGIKQRIKYVLHSIQYMCMKKPSFCMYDDEQVIDEIVHHQKSLARFGDGEFKWMLHIKQTSFQDDSVQLAERLTEVLHNDDDRLILGIPRAFNNLHAYNYEAKRVWKSVITSYGERMFSLVKKDKIYADTNITRPYMDYKRKVECVDRFRNVKKIWDGKDVVIIEGQLSKVGVGNDLLSNANSVQRILCPPKNAFFKYDDILHAAKLMPRNKLFLLSLGPTATILAYDLTKSGYQAVDIGHIDIEYEWYRQRAERKIAIAGKAVNEASDKKAAPKNIDTTQYEQEIISVVH